MFGLFGSCVAMSGNVFLAEDLPLFGCPVTRYIMPSEFLVQSMNLGSGISEFFNFSALLSAIVQIVRAKQNGDPFVFAKN